VSRTVTLTVAIEIQAPEPTTAAYQASMRNRQNSGIGRR
jgi:hypothetical protein